MPNAAYYITLIALTVLMEARGQPRLGQEMVAWTVINRVEVSGLDAESVLYQPGQFTVWNDYDLRLRVLRCAARGVLADHPECARIPGGLGSAEEWERVYTMVSRIYEGETEPPEGFEGVTNFDSPLFWASGEPPWAWAKEQLGCIADHCFWR